MFRWFPNQIVIVTMETKNFISWFCIATVLFCIWLPWQPLNDLPVFLKVVPIELKNWFLIFYLASKSNRHGNCVVMYFGNNATFQSSLIFTTMDSMATKTCRVPMVSRNYANFITTSQQVFSIQVLGAKKIEEDCLTSELSQFPWQQHISSFLLVNWDWFIDRTGWVSDNAAIVHYVLISCVYINLIDKSLITTDFK